MASSLVSRSLGTPSRSGLRLMSRKYFTPHARFPRSIGHSLRTFTRSLSIPRLTAGFGSTIVAVFIPPTPMVRWSLCRPLCPARCRRAHTCTSTAGFGSCLLTPSIFSAPLALSYIKCDITIKPISVAFAHHPAFSAPACSLLPTCAHAYPYAHPTRPPPYIAGVRAAL